jgi:hypothetical protein
MNRALYPENWEEISLAVKVSAGWNCDECGIAHRSDGTNGSILTVHHKDRVPGNCEKGNLVALCARCHLKEEARLRKVERAKQNQSDPG